MKRILILPALAALAFSLTQCSYRETDPLQAEEALRPFELVFSSMDTRTVNDGMSTRWAEGDAFSVFHSSAGSDLFRSDGVFQIDNAETGHATGTVAPLIEGAYDWYAQYPCADASSPRTTDLIFGAEAGKIQTQAGYGSTAHLAGEGFPLFGAGKNVDWQAVPSVILQPLSAVAAVTVTNTLDTPVTLTALSLTAPEPVTGLFQADLLAEPKVYTAENATQVSAVATVEVTGGKTLAKGESAVLYLGFKPFTAPAGSELTLSVTAMNAAEVVATQSKTVTLSAETAFRAGYFRKLSFGFSAEFEEPGPEEYIFNRVNFLTVGKRYLIVVEDGGTYRMAVARGETGEYLETAPVTVDGDVIRLSSLDDVFSFPAAVQSSGAIIAGAYSIRQEDGKFVGVNTSSTSNKLIFSTAAASNSYWWKPESEENPVLIARSKRFCYLSDKQQFAAAPTSGDSGVYPIFFCLQNEEESTEALLDETEYGAYGLPDWLYEAGTMQLSLYRSGSTASFRILQPTDKIITQMSGIPSSLSVEDEFTIHVTRLENGKNKLDKDFLVRVLKVEKDKAWLLSPTGAGFIVMYQ